MTSNHKIEIFLNVNISVFMHKLIHLQFFFLLDGAKYTDTRTRT
jgi:hypothetical protein